MANIWFFTQLIFLSMAIHTMSFDPKQLEVPSSERIAGVFMIPSGGRYIYNASEARDACLSLSATIATKDQMETALQNGLQTCKFGWMEGEVAVIPRKTSDPKCGSNKLGLVTWKAKLKQTFGAFCFKTTDTYTPAVIPVSSMPTAKTAILQNWSTAKSRVRHTPSSSLIKKTTQNPPKWTRRVPTLLVKSTPLSRYSSSTPPIMSSSSVTATSAPWMTSLISVSKSTTSSATPVTTSSFSSPSFHTSATITTAAATKSYTDDSVSLQAVSSSKASLGALPVALIVVGVVFLLATVMATFWYCKLKANVFPAWTQGGRRTDVETEMWKHTDSEMDLHNHLEPEDKTDRKNSSDVTLCINTEIKENTLA